MPEYLCETGIKFYQQGRYSEALQEFNKALLIAANYEPALKYIHKIQALEFQEPPEEKSIEINLEPSRKNPILEREIAMERALKVISRKNPILEREAVMERVLRLEEKKRRKALLSQPKVLTLDELLAKLTGALEIEQGKSLSLHSSGMRRFLVTQPDIIRVERNTSEQILVTGINLGYTYLHVWDANGRHTLEILTVPAKPEGESLEDISRREEEKARNFKLTYSMDWSTYATGARWAALKRSNYYYIHNLGLAGETPYGNLDSSLAVNRYNSLTELTHYTLGLTNGKFGDFKDFTLRAFDFFDIPPDFSNLAFPGIPLRGAMLASPAFNNKLNYTVFSGKENWSGFAGLSPALNQERKAYLEGLNIGFTPTKKQNYKFTLIHGWGKDRGPALKSLGYDLMGDWLLDKWKLGYESASDTKNFANLLKIDYLRPNLSFNAQLRDIDKGFESITGSGWSQGQLGGLFNFNYRPWEKLEIYSSLDLFKDRLYPAPGNNNRWNEDFNWNSVYRVDPLTSLSLNYTLQNELGRISQYRYQSIDAGINRTFKFFKDVNLFLKYYDQQNTNFSSPVSSYSNQRVYAGAKINLTRDLYYYANKEINWLTERSSGNKTQPQAFETGLDWSGQIGKSPLFGACRFTYRDEQDTTSNLSFLSGEDYIEGYSELSYRPTTDTQVYGSCRVRNVWADNPNVNKRLEASFNAGIRFLWDTGINWQAVGDIDGYVFKDLNYDGIMERDEPPVEGIKVRLGRNRTAVTDIFGYYQFKNVRGNKVYVNLDTATIPNGFVLTVPATQGVSISQYQTARVDFGIISRSEIFGYVFEDLDGDNQLDKKDKGIRNVVIILEDGAKRTTDSGGKYSFSSVSSGEHEITLDLNTLPVYYLPKTVLTKKITLFEGVAYNYNIPLKRTKE
ncbi:MAG: SdrD B-like domain-containing protein [Candidatus Omnitrophota bacterium]|nr:SdrD B-like domain-containing protein [Candidatus Omnitrophota bacterium]